eukprot:SAG22_NODE_16987_length_313_cov_1.205607_1_plen_57_part_10
MWGVVYPLAGGDTTGMRRPATVGALPAAAAAAAAEREGDLTKPGGNHMMSTEIIWFH